VTDSIERIRDDVERRLASSEPDVELVALDRVSPDRLRVVVDREGGVDLAACERVTRHLRDLLVEYSLEVSSPGPERPLTKPEHYRRYLGRRARVRTREEHDGRRSFTGELVGATDREVTVAADDGVVSIPYTDVKRGNLLGE
jgi:ribosome maturation factor RimP